MPPLPPPPPPQLLAIKAHAASAKIPSARIAPFPSEINAINPPRTVALRRRLALTPLPATIEIAADYHLAPEKGIC